MRDFNQNLSPNFTRGEFETHESDVTIDMECVDVCQRIRDAWGKPMTITSGVRSQRKNAEVGGSPNSSHLKGLAIDFACTTSRERYLALEVLLNHPKVKRIGIGEDFIHFDIDDSKSQRVVWHYYK